ncbi:hypothetical protein BDV93DRAFT_574727 [Ceratobasidium sp. AG-I]|nr:hypothetical protein BDV93DRAFT_574727 [Ceratobasidium sp. AG-I]
MPVKPLRNHFFVLPQPFDHRSHSHGHRTTTRGLRRVVAQRPRLRLPFGRAKDSYCYYCEDGGSVIDCSNPSCSKTFCYATFGGTGADDDGPEAKSCVTIPEEMINSRSRAFRCPECLAADPPLAMDYTVNRGSRNTRRLSSRSSLVIVVYYLTTLESHATGLLHELYSILAGLEVHVVPLQCKISEHLAEEDLLETVKVLLPEAPFHVAVVFVTEGNDGGGWWWSSDADELKAQSTSERQLLDQTLSTLEVLIKPAVSARVFVIACGMNLRSPSSVKGIFRYLNKRPWNSIVLATAVSLMFSDFACILPELFVELYYFASPFKSSMLRVWAKSLVARTHTGLLIMERSNRAMEELYVSRFENAPPSARPIGVDLPEVTSLCGCRGTENDEANNARWKRLHASTAFGEAFFFFRSTCCGVELHVAIYLDFRRVLQAHGITFVEEAWDRELQRFSFDESDMVVLKISKKRLPIDHKNRPKHDAPWTSAGQKAEELMVEAAKAKVANRPGNYVEIA